MNKHRTGQSLLFLSPFLTVILPNLSLAQNYTSCNQSLVQLDQSLQSSKEKLQEIVADYLHATLVDYQKVLEVYYERKKQTPNPTQFINELNDLSSIVSPEVYASLPEAVKNQPETVDRIYEFKRSEYDLLKEQIDRDPRLANNLFLSLFNRQGGGAANDIFQRLGTYLAESRGITLDLEANYQINAIALYQSRLLFNLVSAQFGYGKNKCQVDKKKANQATKKFFGKIIKFF